MKGLKIVFLVLCAVLDFIRYYFFDETCMISKKDVLALKKAADNIVETVANVIGD